MAGAGIWTTDSARIEDLMLYAPRLSSFRSRLILLLVGLLVAALLATTIAVLRTTFVVTQEQARDDLTVAARVFQSLLEARQEQLLDNAELLANDFGFKDAVTSEDTPTIASALRNHGNRIGADAAFVVSPGGTIRADSDGDGGEEFPFPALLEEAEARDHAAGIVLVDGRPVQLVLVPIRAPDRVAWAALGFQLDQTLANHLRDVTGVEVSFSVTETDPPYLASTLPDNSRASLGQKLETSSLEPNIGAPVTLADADWFTRQEILGLDGNVTAYLQSSQRAAMTPFVQLRNQLLVIASALLLVSLGAAALFARRLTRPLDSLTWAAIRMQGGDYSKPVPHQRETEFHLLGEAFNSMQTAIAERQRAILHQARHDGLTRLPNRRYARDLLDEQVGNLSPTTASLGILVFRITDFRSINDQLGQQTGDHVLQEIARRLQSVDGLLMSARIGNREFMATFNVADTTSNVASDVLARLRDPIRLQAIQIQLTLQGGLAIAPVHGEDADTLLRRAELAMNLAHGEDSGVATYQPGQDESHHRRLKLMAALKNAPESGEMNLVFQPQITLSDQRAVGAEALLRWTHPDLGRISPDEFIPLAEQSGHIGTLTRWVLDQGLRECARWRASGETLHVSINLSARDLSNPALLSYVQEALSTHGLPPSALLLEITETTLTNDPQGAQERLEALRQLGVKLAIDDFGTGYAFLGQLKRLPVNELKIDREFVMQMDSTGEDAAIVRSSIELGHRLGLRIVAEGIENDTVQGLLKEFGCDLGQGYGIARPMEAGDVNDWLTERSHHLRETGKPQ